MTAIYAFADAKNKSAFLCSDNKEYKTNNTVDKVAFLNDRYAFAVCGVSTVYYAGRSLSACNGYDNNPYKETNLKKIIDDIVKYASKMYSYEKPGWELAAKNGNRTIKAQLKAYSSCETDIIILDCLQYKLFHVLLKKFTGSGKGTAILSPLKELAQNKLHLFGLAIMADERKSVNLTVSAFGSDPFGFMRKRIRRDKKSDPRIGDIGACAVKQGGVLEKFTAYKTADQLIDAFYCSS